MNYNFTDRVRKTLAMAREEAIGHRHGVVGPEHLLLALLREGSPEVLDVLAGCGIQIEELQESVAAGLEPGGPEVEATNLPYTSSAKKVLELSMVAARQRGLVVGGDWGGRRPRGIPVDSVALLAGLLAEGRGWAAVALREAGLTPADLGVGQDEERDVPAELPIAIDDASDRSIYEQIVEQIQERIAVGQLQPGERLPTVRRLADRLDIAPGTVARAYGELERLGLVVTQGARGTRVARRTPSASDRERADTLTGLLRPVAVAAFHLGATAEELRSALERAMTDIFRSGEEPAA